MNPSSSTASTASASPASNQASYPPPTNSTAPQHAFPHAAQAAATASAALSQNHTPTPNHIASGNGRKRKPSGAPGSRSVSSLTPDQLAKKRANDREAQRAIRERTRNTIESLENRIRELESQQPFQDLQRVIQERDRALAECEELRRKMTAVAGIVGGQPLSLNELATLTAQQSPLPPISQQQRQQKYPPSEPGPHSQGQTPYEQPLIYSELRASTSASEQPSPASQTTTPGAQQSMENVGMRKWSPSLNHSSNLNGPHQYPTSAPPPAQSNGDRLGLNFLLESSHQQSQTSDSPSAFSHRSLIAQDRPLYARLTSVGPPECILDSLLIEFTKARRQMLRDGKPECEVIGPAYPAFDSMLEPAAYSRPHALSALLIDILSKFPDIERLAEKVAVLHVMFLVLRWQIAPNAENYNNLPPWCRPTTEQLDRQHAQWCDYLPWPHMRRQLVLAEKEVDFNNFFVPYTTTLSLNWPYPQDDVLLSTRSASPDRPSTPTMNPAFEEHMRNLDNWSLGCIFRNTFPHLVDETVRIKDV